MAEARGSFAFSKFWLSLKSRDIGGRMVTFQGVDELKESRGNRIWHSY